MSKAIEEANLFARKLEVEKKRVKVEVKVDAVQSTGIAPGGIS